MRKKLKNYSKNEKLKRKENTVTMAITILIEQVLKVITAMRMTTIMKVKMRKLTPEREKKLMNWGNKSAS